MVLNDTEEHLIRNGYKCIVTILMMRFWNFFMITIDILVLVVIISETGNNVTKIG